MGITFTDLGSDILLIPDVVDLSVCQQIIQVADSCKFLSPPPGSSLTGELRSNEVLPLDNRNPLLESTSQLLLTPFNRVRQALGDRYKVRFSHIELFSLERYKPGQSHKRHMDGLVLSNRYEELAQGIPARDVSVIGFLNEGCEGGELLFDRQAVKVKPPIGGIVAFPARYTHPYQILPVLRGCQYIVVAWMFH